MVVQFVSGDRVSIPCSFKKLVIESDISILVDLHPNLDDDVFLVKINSID